MRPGSATVVRTLVVADVLGYLVDGARILVLTTYDGDENVYCSLENAEKGIYSRMVEQDLGGSLLRAPLRRFCHRRVFRSWYSRQFMRTPVA